MVGTKLQLFYPTWEQVDSNVDASTDRFESGPEAVKKLSDDDSDGDGYERRGSRFNFESNFESNL